MGVAGGRGPLVKARLLGDLQSGIVEGTIGPDVMCAYGWAKTVVGNDAIAQVLSECLARCG